MKPLGRSNLAENSKFKVMTQNGSYKQWCINACLNKQKENANYPENERGWVEISQE